MGDIAARLFDALSGRERAFAYAIAMLAVVACWGVILLSGDRVKSMDEPDFFALAQNLALNGEFAVEPGMPTAYRAPGLVFFLAPFARMGAGLIEMRLVNATLVGFGLVVLFHLVCRHAGPRAGLLAVVLVPLWPVVIYAASTIYPQTLAAFLLVLMLWFLDRVREDQSFRAVASGAAVYGFLVLTVPVILLLGPVLLGWVLLQSKRRLTHTAIFCAVSASMVGAWTVRNYIVFDAFIPVATSSGYNLLAGNTAEARYNSSLDVRFPEYVYTEITGKGEVERNRIFTQAALREITDDPGRAVKLYLAKFAHWFDYSNKLLSDEVVEGGASTVGGSAREAVLFVTWAAVIVGPLMLHLVFCRSFPFRRVELLFLVLWIVGGLAYAIYFTRVRFRLPFDWLVIASNAMFLTAVLEHYVARARVRLAPARRAEDAAPD
ncbi:ArnT family glycosyltransferase [Rhodovulum steppense]|uniref:Dolichyl-phosphate-mannose-protein mannosyltransferase n=1 Tax=Rhodovulum steppense TaxID=540251 RepID=A0A4R1YMH9_9RHOB|nr:glycosyltransferase family 39 protein [Rhodovulum steppense]TCM78976.1 dolichyl-phosphate-mannose-protein mannosyltransferase [Rhodovulum steppense]